VLGNGLGGSVALHLAIRHGHRFARMVLVGSAIAFPEAGRATFRALADRVAQGGMAAVADAAMRRMFPGREATAHGTGCRHDRGGNGEAGPKEPRERGPVPKGHARDHVASSNASSKPLYCRLSAMVDYGDKRHSE
jgi:pimeloyl-ACP methyl ester carboxylesterase